MRYSAIALNCGGSDRDATRVRLICEPLEELTNTEGPLFYYVFFFISPVERVLFKKTTLNCFLLSFPDIAEHSPKLESLS